MTDDIDPELSNLLKELSGAQDSVQASALPVAPVTEEPVIEQQILEKAPELKSEDITEEILAEKEKPVESFVETSVIEEDPNSKIKEDIQNKLLGLISTAVDESKAFNQEMEVDRKKCDDVYNLLVPKIQSGTYSGSDAVALVQILQVKSDISANRSRHMDSIAKILVSLKSNNAVGSGDSGGGGGKSPNDGPSRAEVMKLLNTPVDE